MMEEGHQLMVREGREPCYLDALSVTIMQVFIQCVRCVGRKGSLYNE